MDKKNNSGKSSVLEAIKLEKNRNLGRTIYTDDIKSLITNFEAVTTKFKVVSKKNVALKCHYCEKITTQENLQII